MPKFPKVGEPPIVVDEGDPITLRCEPPNGAVSRQLYWMSLGKYCEWFSHSWLKLLLLFPLKCTLYV